MAAIVVAWALALLGFMHLRRRRLDLAQVAWMRLGRRLARAGLPRRPDEGPLAYAQRAATRWPQWSDLLRRIGANYALLRYGPRDARHGERLGALRQGVAALPGARTLRAAKPATS